jgi:peptidoglycan/LPS O-acetylase OafA/YrhL
VAKFGQYWVQFFFALSGLVLYISQGGKHEVASSSMFVMKRIRGVFPAYLIGTLLALLARPQVAWNYLSQELGFMMVQTWFNPYGTAFPPDGPAWFVCTLFAFWLCFPHWYGFLHGFRWPKLAMLFAYLSTFGIPLVYFFLDDSGSTTGSSFSNYNPLSNWQTFFFGMCLGRILQDLTPEDVPQALGKVAASSALVVLASLPFLLPSLGVGLHNATSTVFFDKGPFLLPFFAVLLFFVPLGLDVLLKPAVLESTFCKYLGEVSGDLFLLHYPIKLIVDHTGLDIGVPLLLILQILVAVAFHEMQKTVMGPGRSNRDGKDPDSKEELVTTNKT